MQYSRLCLKKEEYLNEINLAITKVRDGVPKINALWIETSGCFGEIISLLNADDPDLLYMFQQFLNVQFWGTIQGDDGEEAFERILNTMDTEFILMVDGAIPTRSEGVFTTIATYKGKRITALELVKMLGSKAKYVVAMGTCACYGGITAATPNVSKALSLSEVLERTDIIKMPGCPANPKWTIGLLGFLVTKGIPPLDSDNRPLAYFEETIHDRCPRRKYFDAGIFAKKFGMKECMFLLGCRGPETKSYCSVTGWNNSDNWPIGNNSTCIGCMGSGFPDSNEPFVQYGGWDI